LKLDNGRKDSDAISPCMFEVFMIEFFNNSYFSGVGIYLLYNVNWKRKYKTIYTDPIYVFFNLRGKFRSKLARVLTVIFG
jgi:hypothetical protein